MVLDRAVPREAQAVHPADPGTRRRLLVAIAVTAIAGIAACFALEDWLAGLKDEDPVVARAALLRALLIGAYVTALLMATLAAWYWRWGRRIGRAGRYPPPGAKLARDTPIVEGPAAQSRGLLFRVLAAALLLSAIGFVSAVHLLAGRLGAAS